MTLIKSQYNFDPNNCNCYYRKTCNAYCNKPTNPPPTIIIIITTLRVLIYYPQVLAGSYIDCYSTLPLSKALGILNPPSDNAFYEHRTNITK
jgi:hypothetical protein